MADIYRAAWEDLAERLMKARAEARALQEKEQQRGYDSVDFDRLEGKLDGLGLALNYMRGYSLSTDAISDYIADFNSSESMRARDELQKQIAKLENELTTAHMDLRHLRSWLMQQRDGEEQAILNLAKRGEMGSVVGAAGRMKAYSTVLDELSRLERA